jgi:hypothetical protein
LRTTHPVLKRDGLLQTDTTIIGVWAQLISKKKKIRFRIEF